MHLPGQNWLTREGAIFLPIISEPHCGGGKRSVKFRFPFPPTSWDFSPLKYLFRIDLALKKLNKKVWQTDDELQLTMVMIFKKMSERFWTVGSLHFGVFFQFFFFFFNYWRVLREACTLSVGFIFHRQFWMCSRAAFVFAITIYCRGPTKFGLFVGSSTMLLAKIL